MSARKSSLSVEQCNNGSSKNRFRILPIGREKKKKKPKPQAEDAFHHARKRC